MDMASCHCFRDRSYDPDNRFAADDYLLATSYNSLIARTFGISKGEIIMKKMRGGVNGNDLLIGLFLGATCGRSPELLLAIHDDGGTWQQITSSACGDKKSNDPALSALAQGNDARTVALITDFMLKKRYPPPEQAIKKIRSRLADDKKVALVLALAEQTGLAPDRLLTLYLDQKKSFAQIAHSHGLTPEAVGRAVLQDNP